MQVLRLVLPTIEARARLPGYSEVRLNAVHTSLAPSAQEHVLDRKGRMQQDAKMPWKNAHLG